jgi:uncharacterized membrane protein YphA (DoxX/SURF4 family)
MNIALWCAQILLAAVFLGSGTVKSLWPKERLVASGQTGVQFFSQPAIRLIAASELLGAVGVILPWLTGIAPVLTPIAAIGLAVVMVGAAVTHARLREPQNVAVNTVLFAVCLFVAWGRLAG